MTNKPVLELWTIYDNPKDYPGLFVARKFEYDKPTKDYFTANSLEAIRELIPKNLTRLNRFEDDEPQIVEVWL